MADSDYRKIKVGQTPGDISPHEKKRRGKHGNWKRIINQKTRAQDKERAVKIIEEET